MRTDDIAMKFAHEAIPYVVGRQNGSRSYVQRKLRVGFVMAGSVMEILEAAKVTGPTIGTKAHPVLFSAESVMAAHNAVTALANPTNTPEEHTDV